MLTGFVDVWWLHDDGGLTLLLSHLLREHNTYLPVMHLSIDSSDQSTIAKFT